MRATELILPDGATRILSPGLTRPLAIMPALESMVSRRNRVLGWLNNGLSVAGALVSLGLFACLASVTVLNLPQATEAIKGILK